MREEKKLDKVEAIFRAIEELVAEGADLASMRVSDIALKAGIGKGTAYEYFSSKEEMVVKAMLYLMRSMVMRILGQMEKVPTFQDAFMMLLDEMEEKAKQRACVMKYLSMFNDMNLCQQMHDVVVTDPKAKEANPLNIIRYLIKRGQEEGIFGRNYPQAYMETSLFSKVISFMMFVNKDLGDIDYDNEGMKLALYQGACREFSTSGA